jgi:rhamnulokinase
MTGNHYIACDLGAESGRVMLGHLRDGRLALEEIHRFPNGAIKILGSLRWDVLRIFDELKAGLRKVAALGLPIAGVSVDSWGLDYVLVRGRQPHLTPPFSYRDTRNDRGWKIAMEKAGRESIFAETGIQFIAINTLYQLLAEAEQYPEIHQLAETFLTIGDYFNWLFSGEARAEESNASTTQLYNPTTRNWSAELIRIFNLPRNIFPPIVKPGTILGALLPEINAETGLARDVKVLATCTHDTGAAVAAVPARGDDWAYLSSGTWSLIGVELPEPNLGAAALAKNFTNEVGYGGTIRFLKNIVGLWILQECRREWADAGKQFGYDQLTKLAAEAEPLGALIFPNDPRFLRPGDMPEKVRSFCKETDQPAPENPGEIVRCILESLALLYRKTLDDIEEITGRKIRALHVVGGGSKSKLFNQLIANATGRNVLAGPVEATAIGNVLVQAIGLGHLASLDELRRVVRDSFPLETYEPHDASTWLAARERFANLDAAT